MKFILFYNKLKVEGKIIFWLLASSLLISLIFLIKLCFNGYWLWGSTLQMDATGQFGDFIGGTVGTIFSGIGFYLLYITLVEQRSAINNQKDAFQRERFEAKFFDLIKLHRENVSDQTYTKFEKSVMQPNSSRKVFRMIHKEFEECFTEVKRFHKIYGDNFMRNSYRRVLEKIRDENTLNIDITEFALINISYTILFFGVARDSEAYLSNNFKQKFNDDYYNKLIKFLQLKPKREYTIEYACWIKFIELPLNEIQIAYDEIFLHRRVKDYNFHLNHRNFFSNYRLEKYYGGHQHRLGHYYRHLFQSYKFLDMQEILNDTEKYIFGKTLRAQLSTYEQSLLFLNSISTLGLRWELTPEIGIDDKPIKLISKYQLIKNVPGVQVLNINYKNYYPSINFEFDSQ